MRLRQFVIARMLTSAWAPILGVIAVGGYFFVQYPGLLLRLV